MGKLKTLTAFLVGIVLVTVGFALNTFSATTPPQASDGYYELDSYEDLVWFQQYIDAGNLEINARLTADIVANENLLNDNGTLNGTPSNVWTPIGRNFTLAAKSYNGTLDGAGHSITGLFFYDTKGAGYYGLFAKMGRGTVKNLAIVDSFFAGTSNSNYVGTFVGEGYAVNVENCYSNAIIYASDYYGGIVGKTSVANIRNCLYTGTFRILGSSIYADPIVKKNSTDNSIRVYNCYYKGDCGLNSSTVATAVTTNGLASGQVTYLLNRNQSSDVWRQNIDIGEKDSNPTLDSSHHIVFYYNNTYTNYCSVHSWKNGICVEEFAIGIGPTIFGKQFGETKFSLKLLPFGGACMMGEDDVDDMSEGSFNSKSVWARMSVIVAGPVFNLILAWILCMIIIGWTGYRAPIVSNVTDGYSAQEEGIEPGDVIKKIGGKSVHIWNDISLYNMMHAGAKSVEVEYERDGKDYTVVLEPKQNEGDAFPLLGITGGEMVRPGLFGTVRYGAYTVKYWITYTVDSLKMLVGGKVGVKDLSGPVGIVSAVDNVYQEAAPAGMVVVILNLLNIGVLLTANLGVMNLLPLPALDGGRLVFLIIEAVRGKRVPPEKEGMVHFAGFVFLMALMVVIMFNDILKLV